MKVRTLTVIALAALLAPIQSIAQAPPSGAAAGAAPAPAPGGGRGGAPAVVSPEVSADGKVTFRYRAPNAQSVSVAGLPTPVAMTKDPQGVWSATASLSPDIYSYGFTVDGARVADPANPVEPWASAATTGTSSPLLVPGAPWTNTKTVHGAVTKVVYNSPIIGASETYYVYTPPGYDAKRKQPYPVVVMLHGLGDKAEAWINNGGANLTLDDLIGSGKAVPMILVSPSAYGNADGTRGAAAGFPNFTNVVIKEIMPQVLKSYNASTKAVDHAIGGLSMGAAQSPLMLNHLDQFAWIGAFSPGFDMYAPARSAPQAAGGGAPPGAAQGAQAAPAGPGRGAAPAAAPAARGAPAAAGVVRQRAVLADGNLAAIFPALDAKANSKIKLLYIACGTNDDHLELTRQFKSFLDERKVKVTTYLESPGYGHVWPYWRLQFADFAQLLFKTTKAA